MGPNDRSTLVSLFCDRVARSGSRQAGSFPAGAGYLEPTWTELSEQVRRTAAGLVRLGVQPGDRVVLVSENRLEWIVADLGTLMAGGVNVPIQAALAGPQIAEQIRDCGARLVMLSGPGQAAKLLAVRAELPRGLEFVTFDPCAGLHALGGARTLADLQAGVGANEREQVQARRLAEGTARDLATILYTSGTTGEPKGVMLTHGNLVSNTLASMETLFISEDDVRLSWLPLSHIFARTVDYYLWVASGSRLCLARGLDTLMEDLRRVRPTLFSTVPYFLDKVMRALTAAGQADDPAAVREAFGGRLRVIVSGGAPLPDHLAEFFLSRGVPAYQGYGLTESSPVISTNTLSANKIGTVDRPIPGVEVRIAEDGEILTRGPHVMVGYWNKPEATAAAIRDGWLYTGDIGELDADGYLRITGRKKEIIVTAAGKKIAPVRIEALLTEDPCIEQAVVYAEGRNYAVGLIVPNYKLLGEEARRQGLPPLPVEELVREPGLVAFMQERVTAALGGVSKFEQVKRIALLPAPFSVEAGELTATLKLRRARIYERYQDTLAALYQEPAVSPVSAVA
ncbi:MAG: AMP-binding protein [Phycisphaerae bacterium]